MKVESLALRGARRELRMRASTTEESGVASGSRPYADAMMAVAEPVSDVTRENASMLKAAAGKGISPRRLLQVRVTPNSDAVLIISCMLAMQLLWPKGGKPGSMNVPVSAPCLRLRSPSPLCSALPSTPTQPAGDGIDGVWQ